MIAGSRAREPAIVKRTSVRREMFAEMPRRVDSVTVPGSEHSNMLSSIARHTLDPTVLKSVPKTRSENHHPAAKQMTLAIDLNELPTADPNVQFAEPLLLGSS